MRTVIALIVVIQRRRGREVCDDDTTDICWNPVSGTIGPVVVSKIPHTNTGVERGAARKRHPLLV